MYFPMVPNSFIYSCVDLCWRDVRWGYERRLVGWKLVVEFADFNVSNGSVESLEIDLICLGEIDIREIEEKMYLLSEQEKETLAFTSKQKWLFITLKWLYENQRHVVDPLGSVELVYEDFDFPTEIESFVRYMPARGGYKPEEYTAQQNIDRLFCNWREYLERMADVFTVAN